MDQIGRGPGQDAGEPGSTPARLDNLAAGVEAGKGTVGKLMEDTTLADEAQKLLAQGNHALGGLQVVITNLNVAVGNVRKGTERMPEITGAVADEAKEVPALVRQTEASMRELERLIEAMQRHWLIRKYVNHTNPPPELPLPEVTEPVR